MGCLNYNIGLVEGMSASVNVVPTEGISATIEVQAPMSIYVVVPPSVAMMVSLLSTSIKVTCTEVCSVGY